MKYTYCGHNHYRIEVPQGEITNYSIPSMVTNPSQTLPWSNCFGVQQATIVMQDVNGNRMKCKHPDLLCMLFCPGYEKISGKRSQSAARHMNTHYTCKNSLKTSGTSPLDSRAPYEILWKKLVQDPSRRSLESSLSRCTKSIGSAASFKRACTRFQKIP